MTTYTKSRCKVMFGQCTGNGVITSCAICITSLNSEDVPTMRNISISQILVFPDIRTSRLLLCHVSSHASQRFHPRFTRFLPRLLPLPRSLSRIPRNQDHEIAPEIAAMAWYFSPKSCVERILTEICCLCSVFLT